MTHIDSLERRRLLSVSLSSGTLRLYTDNAADEVELRLRRDQTGTLAVTVNGTAREFVAANVRRIIINTYDGNDRIDLEGLRIKTRITAGAGDDRVIGGASRDRIYGGDGHDRIEAGGGADTVGGEAGDDSLNGGSGDDLVGGGDGNDVLYGSSGDDLLYGGGGNDLVRCGDGDDDSYGDDGDDSLWGGHGNDYLSGQVGDDLVCGEAGDDSIGGGDGNDRIYGGRGADMFGALGTQDERKDFESDEGDSVQSTFGESSFLGGSFLYGPEVILRDLGHK